jgi:hypothetical protein
MLARNQSFLPIFFTSQVVVKSCRATSIVPLMGSTSRTSQPYSDLFVPLEMLVKVAVPGVPRPGRMKINVFVGVGDAVSVAPGVYVNVAVAVEVGNAAAVCVDAAFAVCAMNVLIALGAAVGAKSGLAAVGRQAITHTNAINQINTFFLGITKTVPQLFNHDRDVGVAHIAFHHPGHHVFALFRRRDGVNDDRLGVARFEVGAEFAERIGGVFHQFCAAEVFDIVLGRDGFCAGVDDGPLDVELVAFFEHGQVTRFVVDRGALIRLNRGGAATASSSAHNERWGWRDEHERGRRGDERSFSWRSRLGLGGKRGVRRDGLRGLGLRPRRRDGQRDYGGYLICRVLGVWRSRLRKTGSERHDHKNSRE